VNLGNPVETTMLELAETILGLTGSASKIEYRPIPADDPVRRCPDISLARKTLGWQPTTTLEEGLRRTIMFFEDVLRGSAADSITRPAENS
jgi:UDP-glucuronate decarboxylase